MTIPRTGGSCLALLLLLLLAACGGGGRDADEIETLVIGRAVSTGALDPGFLREPATIVDNVFDTLVTRDQSMRLAPGLATSWTLVDETTWEFDLRRDVSFHNGEPFDASAVKFTLERVLDPARNAPTISYIRTVDHVEIVDEHTVRIVTARPDPLIPTRMSRYPTYIVPPGYLREVGPETFARQPVGTGPYRLAEWVRDDHLTLVANEEYWRGAPAIPRVVWRPIPEPTSRVTALLAGEVDLIDEVPVDQVARVERSPSARIERVRHGGLVVYLGLKMSAVPFDRRDVRQAISSAIDRASIVEHILRGYATVTGSQVGPLDLGYLAIEAPPYDPDRARMLLARAGLADGLDVSMQTSRRYLKGAEVGQAIAQQLGEVGIRVSLDVPEWSVYIQQVPAGRQAPLYMLGWGSTQTLDADAALYAIFKSGEPYSTASLPRLDELLLAAREEMDPDTRTGLYHDIQRLAQEEVPVVTLYHEDALFGLGTRVEWRGRVDARIPLREISLN